MRGRDFHPAQDYPVLPESGLTAVLAALFLAAFECDRTKVIDHGAPFPDSLPRAACLFSAAPPAVVRKLLGVSHGTALATFFILLSLFSHVLLELRFLFLPRRPTTAFAALTAAPSSPVRRSTEFATCAACRFALAPSAFFECRHLALTGHGMTHRICPRRPLCIPFWWCSVVLVYVPFAFDFARDECCIRFVFPTRNAIVPSK